MNLREMPAITDVSNTLVAFPPEEPMSISARSAPAGTQQSTTTTAHRHAARKTAEGDGS
jgi:hypothetical protein